MSIKPPHSNENDYGQNTTNKEQYGTEQLTPPLCTKRMCLKPRRTILVVMTAAMAVAVAMAMAVMMAMAAVLAVTLCTHYDVVFSNKV